MGTRKVKPTKPHFFKPLLPGFQQHMVIPESFYLKYMEGKKGCKAVLKTLMGKFWHVKLNGRLIEGDGWEEFCEDEELEVGHFLVFGLVEDDDVDLVFDILVFDQTTCLRDSSFIKEEIQQQVPNESAGHSKNKKQDINFAAQAGASVHQHPYFVSKLSYYAANSATLFVPTKFARENGLCNRRCDIVLVNEQGKEWLASLRFRRSDGQIYINQSWSAFCHANSIKAGDSCIFRLIHNGKKPVLKITRCPKGLNPKPKTEKQPRKLQVYVTVKPSYIKNYLLNIPAKFAEKSGLKRKLPEEMIIRNYKRGKSWTVTPQRSKDGVIYLGSGWTAFARSNGIKVGDVLKLELVKKGIKPVIKISGVNLGKKGSKKGKQINQKMSSETEEDVKPIVKF